MLSWMTTDTAGRIFNSTTWSNSEIIAQGNDDRMNMSSNLTVTVLLCFEERLSLNFSGGRNQASRKLSEVGQ